LIDLERSIQERHRNGVEFIIIDGVAATIHGSARVTQDLNIVYTRTPENITRLAAALASPTPYLRGAPPGARRISRPLPSWRRCARSGAIRGKRRMPAGLSTETACDG
jgi:hypothetical protein